MQEAHCGDPLQDVGSEGEGNCSPKQGPAAGLAGFYFTEEGVPKEGLGPK